MDGAYASIGVLVVFFMDVFGEGRWLHHNVVWKKSFPWYPRHILLEGLEWRWNFCVIFSRNCSLSLAGDEGTAYFFICSLRIKLRYPKF